MEAQDDDAVSFSSRGSTVSGWGRRRMTENDKRTATWRQLYLSRAKLKAVSRTSALIAGFAMIAMVEVQLDSSIEYPPVLLVTFSTVTTCLVSVHLFALMISTCLLPNIEAISNIHSLNAAKYSPHVKMRNFIEVSWILSTGVGLVLFLVEIALLIWLKFYGMCAVRNCGGSFPKNQTCIDEKCRNGDIAAWSATAVLIPVILVFAGFAFHFYRSLAKHKYGMLNSVMREITDFELREDDMSCRMQRASVLEVGMHNHHESSRMQSGLSGSGVQLRTNGPSNMDNRLNADSFLQENENTNSGRTTPSIDLFVDKEQ